MTEIKTLASKTVYENKWMRVREDRIQRPSGAEGIFGVVEKPDFVVIIPISDGCIHLVEQYRYPVQGRYWELPQGSWEENSDTDHAIIAAGELHEETGLIAGQMQYVGHQYLAYGYSTQGYHIYLATDLQQHNTALDQEEEGLIAQSFTLAQFEEMIVSCVIKDATSVNAYNLARLKGFIK
ncbi:NUDIX hydrolase [Cellvibrio sp. KY-GH-1]|uniref:NUDIX domain-containing protein n=1 Tax=Cellvibrio sp. KY-GH-1 TaxID=2303332 RepID=UPI001243B558|nr:NUDIX hydrolase [Cellvibrio sp. KY-GH-1]QEY17903.1 NUDIX hydrolase [Cellvibrio sp. KY-GH-1]